MWLRLINPCQARLVRGWVTERLNKFRCANGINFQLHGSSACAPFRELRVLNFWRGHCCVWEYFAVWLWRVSVVVAVDLVALVQSRLRRHRCAMAAVVPMTPSALFAQMHVPRSSFDRAVTALSAFHAVSAWRSVSNAVLSFLPKSAQVSLTWWLLVFSHCTLKRCQSSELWLCCCCVHNALGGWPVGSKMSFTFHSQQQY